jgi:inhibitor of cysteine peptidase
MAMDLEKEGKTNLFTFLGGGNELFMSENNLYLTKANYTMASFGKQESSTDIHKFSIDGINVSFQSNATVAGTILNQFSMDEFNGDFRIATTSGEAWFDDSSSQLYTFNKDLKMIGKLENLAPGEQIYSVRFLNERIYLVTFCFSNYSV